MKNRKQIKELQEKYKKLSTSLHVMNYGTSYFKAIYKLRDNVYNELQLLKSC